MAAIHPKISLMQMYKYGLAFDIDIFESLSLSFSEGLKEKVVNRLCLQTIDYSVIVADLNWLKFTIQSITDAYEYSFERWFNALNMKYNPIENYDRFEEFDTNSSANSQVGTSSHTEGTDLNSVNAYDKIELVPESSVYNNSNSNISSESGGSSSENRKGRIHGNIGVTTSQQMLEQEFKIGYYNIVDMIVDIYKKELVIPCI